MRKPFFGTLALAVMTWLAQAQDKPGAEKSGTQKPALEKPALPTPAKDQPGTKTAPTEKDKGAPQKQAVPLEKGPVPPAGAAKSEPPKTESMKKEAAKNEPAKVLSALTDWDKLKGEWVSANYEYDGRSFPADGRWNVIFATEKDKQTIKVTGNPPTLVFWTGQVRLDGTKTQREITLVLPALIGERLQRGIYSLQGDYLTIAWATGFDSPRPASFAVKPDVETDDNKHVKADPSWMIATWVRKKPPAPK
jgi:uncharacterized protein (TIGR03067 family)